MKQKEISIRENTLKNDIKITSGKLIKVIFILSIIGQIGTVVFTKISSQNLVGIELSEGVKDFLKTSLPVIIFNISVIFMAEKSTKISIKKDIFCKNEGSLKFTVMGSMFCIFIGMIGGMITSVVVSGLNSNGIDLLSPNFDFSQNTILGMILNLGYTCLLAPIFEEIIFRGFILKNIQKYGSLTAVIVSAVLFGMNHLNLVQILPTIFLGIIFAIITIKSKSIIPAIIAHISNNIVSALINFLGAESTVLLGVFIIALIFVLIIGSLIFIISYNKQITIMLQDNDRTLRVSQKVVASFSGGWAISYILFFVAMVLLGIIG